MVPEYMKSLPMSPVKSEEVKATIKNVEKKSHKGNFLVVKTKDDHIVLISKVEKRENANYLLGWNIDTTAVTNIKLCGKFGTQATSASAPTTDNAECNVADADVSKLLYVLKM